MHHETPDCPIASIINSSAKPLCVEPANCVRRIWKTEQAFPMLRPRQSCAEVPFFIAVEGVRAQMFAHRPEVGWFQ